MDVIFLLNTQQDGFKSNLVISNSLFSQYIYGPGSGICATFWFYKQVYLTCSENKYDVLYIEVWLLKLRYMYWFIWNVLFDFRLLVAKLFQDLPLQEISKCKHQLMNIQIHLVENLANRLEIFSKIIKVLNILIKF